MSLFADKFFKSHHLHVCFFYWMLVYISSEHVNNKLPYTMCLLTDNG